MGAAGVMLTGVWAAAPVHLSKNFLDPMTMAPADSDSTTLPYPFPDNIADPFSNSGSQSPMYMGDPSNVNTTIEYDPFDRQYNINQNIGSMFYRNPSYMRFDDFVEQEFRNSTRNYWKQRAGEESQVGRKGLIPKLHVGGQVFDRIFGGNTIDIRPQGSAELVFGANISRNENPSLPEKQRSLSTFDFKEKIQMNVIGNIGDKLKITTNYNTEATFDFENQMKLEYTGYEDEIIKKIEAGNVTLPLTGSLITGSQSLFGIKTALQFGRLTMTSVFSQQKGKTSSVRVTGGAQTSTFDIAADQYEANKHYFISQYFRDNYEIALSNLPIINSPVNINRIEVWVTNRTGVVDNTRNIVAFMDLGERNFYNQGSIIQPNPNAPIYPTDSANTLYSELVTNYNQIRDINVVNTNNGLLQLQPNFTSPTDYEKLENARKLNPAEYTYNARLGFISLNQALNADEVLAVAFEYTVGNTIYRVGDLSTGGINAPSALFVKLLKSTNVSTKLPTWGLMMKNIYSIGAFQVNQKDFRLDVLYFDSNNGNYINYIPAGPTEPRVNGIPLIQLLNLDRLNSQNDPQPDGVFDFIPATTINTANGRVIFPVVEPFGNYLKSKFDTLNSNLFNNYVFNALYDSTRSTAQQQFPQLNKFSLRGSYQSSSSSEIPLNAFNIPQGAVTVTAGGIKLTENIDYTVDYNLGRVKIINQGILNSGTPIDISLESNSLFSIQSKTLIGTRLDYQVNKEFSLGGTILHLNERPLTKKINIGDEPISNTIWGLDGTWRTDSRFITKMVDKIPFIETKAPSQVTVTGEFAQFVPGHPNSISKEGTSYIDDFEGSQSTIDLKNIGSWFMASTPQNQTDLFPEGALSNNLTFGFNRARLGWYIIDPLFYRNNSLTPDHIKNDPNQQSNHYVREVLETEIFPNKESATGQATSLSVLNLAYYPNERGPYNYDVDGLAGFSSGLNADGSLANPTSRWAGMQRRIETNDFEAANVEYIEFWMLDPFIYGNTAGGDLYFNLGNVSEDILRDGRKSFENGLPSPNNVVPTAATAWGLVPQNQSIVNAFDNDEASRAFQDVGLDGLRTIDERTFFDSTYVSRVGQIFGTGSTAYINALDDPSSDNFHYFRGSDFDNGQVTILNRYKRFNNQEGNSPTSSQSTESYPTSSTTIPDGEDINRDNTLSEAENYYQYKVKITPTDLEVGKNFITDKVTATVKLANNNVETVTWYQVRIPVQDPERVVGSIEDFKSIRFMRMFMKGFDSNIIIRFAKFQLVRGEWRKYNFDLSQAGEYVPIDNSSGTTFDVATVNIEENSNRTPIPYVLPPGIDRETNIGTSNLQQLNEQSLVLKTCNLEDGHARAAYKTTQFDVRTYKRIKMFIHAEAGKAGEVLKNGDMSVFIRFGTDFNSNYYEYEIPLTITPDGTTNPDIIWPSSNLMDIELEKMQLVKQQRNVAMQRDPLNFSFITPFTGSDGTNRITVVGNPNLSNVRTIMIGVRNPKKVSLTDGDDGLAKCAEIWVNELRLSDFDESGGWAANARITTKLADFGTVTLAGSRSTFGFGSLEKKVAERSQNDITSYDVSSTLELGKFFPEKTGIRVPMYLGYSETFSNPQYNPLDPDIKLKTALEAAENKTQRDSIIKLTQDYTMRKGVNFTNVKKDRIGSAKAKIYDVENLSLTYAYTEEFKHSINTEFDSRKTYNGALGYNFSAQPKHLTPLSKVNVFGKSKYSKLISDLNFNYKPSTLAFRTDINRTYQEAQVRNTAALNIKLDPTYYKDFRWNRRYEFRHDITKSLKFDFNANNDSRVDEPAGKLDTQAKKDSLWGNFWDLGRNTKYHHTGNVTYALPMSKLPFLDWTTVNARYTVDYDWQAPSLAAINFGNTIQNSNRKELNTQFNMVNLYNKIKVLKKINDEKPKNTGRPLAPSPPKNPADSSKKEKVIPPAVKVVAKFFMGVKNISVNYSETNGTMLPGYTPGYTVLGQDWQQLAPGTGFIFGSQKDIRDQAVANNWLTKDTTLNVAYLTNNTKTLNGRATIEPVQSLRIELTANRTESNNQSEYFRADQNGVFQSFSPQEGGSYSISFLTWQTAFIKDNSDKSSPVFANFAEFRKTISNRLGEQNANSIGLGPDGFSDGYGGTSQEVLTMAFLAAYTGKNADNVKLNMFPQIPLPNWRITFDGLSKLPFAKELFSSVNLSHAYRSTYNVNSFTSNLNYLQSGGTSRDASGNFVPRYEIAQISISEQFAPLMGIDVTWKNGFQSRVEIKKDRTVSLIYSQVQMTEVKGTDLVIGAGYRIRKFRLPLKLFGSTTNLENDLNLSADLSIRKNQTIIRKLVEQTNQLTAGTTIVSIKTAADYVINDRFNIRLFYDQTLTNPAISSSFPTSNTSVGLSLRFTLAQ